jgi:Fe2+ transport system protein FeoA
MPEDNQTLIPRSFIDLFVPPGRIKPTEPRDVIARRYDLCEDLAQMLTDTARARLFEKGISESEVLERIHCGLLAGAAVVEVNEARWVLFRLAELLEWPAPDLPDPV